MIFWLFINACKKHKFCYSLNNNNGLSIMLYPYYRLDRIEIHDYSYIILFIKAIKEMREYK